MISQPDDVALFDRYDLAALRVDLAGNITAWNDAAVRVFGCERGAVLGKPAAGYFRWSENILSAGFLARLGEMSSGEVIAHFNDEDGGESAVRLKARADFSWRGKMTGVTLVAAAESLGPDSSFHDFTRAFDNLPGQIALASLDGTITYWSRGAEESTGYSAEEVIGQSAEVLYAQNYSADFNEKILKPLIEHGHFNGEVELKRKSGETYKAQLSLAALTDPGTARRNGLIGIALDLTERDEKNQEFNQQQDFLQLVNRMQAAFIYNPDNPTIYEDLLENIVRVLNCEGGIIVTIDDAGGYSVIASLGDAADVAIRQVPFVADKVGSGKSLVLRPLDENEHTVFQSGLLVHGFDLGDRGRGLTILWDGVEEFGRQLPEVASAIGAVTGQLIQAVETRRELAEVQDRYLRAGAIDGIWEWNIETGEEYLSPRWLSMLGYERGDLKESIDTFTSLLHPDDVDRAWVAANGHLDEGLPFDVDTRVRCKNGEYLWVRTRGQLDDERHLMIGSISDISARKEAELRLQESLAEKEILLREVHHRVKNNLQWVSSIVYFESQAIWDPEAKQAFEELQVRLRAISMLHEHLYTMDNVSSVLLSSYLPKILESILASYQLESKGIELRSSIDDIPVSLEDGLAIGVIVTELVSNAFKYAFNDRDNGEIVVTVKSSQAGGGQQLAIMVADNGRGFDKSRWGQERFGSKLVTALAEQLGASLEFSGGPGTTVEIVKNLD